MNKTLVSTLSAAIIAATASTTFAAANPFEDVPADHWAYDAIAQLAADGVIEGYGDGTYRGDQEITRYEMAQMVARAMAKGTGDKALIDKLAAEFADELNSLGVRVANLEKKVDNVKWTGAIRYRYINQRNDGLDTTDGVFPTGMDTRNNAQYLTLRFEPSMEINKNWTGHARIDYNLDMDSASNNGPVRRAPWDGNVEETGMRVERAWVQGDYKNLTISLGRLPYVSFIDEGMIMDSNVSGGQITFGKEIMGTVTVGRYNSNPDVNNGNTFSYQGVEIYNNRDHKITWGVGYHHVSNKTYWRNFYADDGKDSANLWEVGLGWKFDKNCKIHGAYAWNTAGDANNLYGMGISTDQAAKSWSVQLDYKGADPKKAGSWGAFIAYRDLGAIAGILPTYDAMTLGQKGSEIGFDIVPMRNIQATFKYFWGKDKKYTPYNLNDTRETASRFFTELNFFF